MTGLIKGLTIMSTIGGIGGFSSAQYVRQSFQPPSFESLDQNGDSTLSLDELKSAAPGGATGTNADKRAEALFSAMDADSDGSVTSAEKDAFDARMAERFTGSAFMAQQMAAPDLAEIFAQTDADGDGAVSLEEFGAEATDQSQDVLQKLFDLIDSDGDGAISETESTSFLEALGQEVASLGGAGGPPPGGPPPGGPPPGGGAEASATEDEEEEDTTSILDLLASAQQAYGASQQQSLLDQLASIFNEAA